MQTSPFEENQSAIGVVVWKSAQRRRRPFKKSLTLNHGKGSGIERCSVLEGGEDKRKPGGEGKWEGQTRKRYQRQQIFSQTEKKMHACHNELFKQK